MKLAEGSQGRSRPFGVAEHQSGAPVTGLVFGSEAAMFAHGDGAVRFWKPFEEKPYVIEVHRGAILTAVADGTGNSFITGGDDGLVAHTRSDGTKTEISAARKRWIDHVAFANWGAIALSSGKIVEVARPRRTDRHHMELPSSCGGLAFAPKGERLAAAHYGGATIASLAHPSSTPDKLVWKGSHLAITWSPDARFLVTAMQENSLHIWRLADKRDLHMRGYTAKPLGLAWAPKRAVLATTGYFGTLLWSFDGRDGPQGRMAEEVGRRPDVATAVAWHPHSPVLAIGYRDGVILLAEPERFAGTIFLLRDDGDEITHLSWSPSGQHLAYGSASGAAGVVDCAEMRKGGAMTLNPFAPRPRAGMEDPQTRIMGWIRLSAPVNESDVISVTEVACKEKGCPPRETVMVVIPKRGPRLKLNIEKAMSEVTERDVLWALRFAEVINR